jgi:hypothetical protein
LRSPVFDSSAFDGDFAALGEPEVTRVGEVALGSDAGFVTSGAFAGESSAAAWLTADEGLASAGALVRGVPDVAGAVLAAEFTGDCDPHPEHKKPIRGTNKT